MNVFMTAPRKNMVIFCRRPCSDECQWSIPVCHGDKAGKNYSCRPYARFHQFLLWGSRFEVVVPAIFRKFPYFIYQMRYIFRPKSPMNWHGTEGWMGWTPNNVCIRCGRRLRVWFHGCGMRCSQCVNRMPMSITEAYLRPRSLREQAPVS